MTATNGLALPGAAGQGARGLQIDLSSSHADIEINSDRGDQRIPKAFYVLWERHKLPQ